MDAVPATVERMGWRSRWRRLLAAGLTPREVGWGAGIGAAMGVAPIPGLQMATCGLIAWRWRLNLPVMLLASNISFGPLLVLWAVLAICLGRGLRTLTSPWAGWRDLHASFVHAGEGFSQFMAAIAGCVWDWVLGSLLLMPLLGLLVGVVAWGCAAAVSGWRAGRARRA